MKKIILAFKAIILLLFLQSCKKPDFGPKPVIPNCAWDRTEMIIYSKLQLMYPAGLSDYHTRLLPLDKIDRSFLDVILRNSDIGPSGYTGNIRANIKSDGTKCIGERTTTYDKSNYTSGLTGYFIRTPFPSNASFVGEITVTIKSNVYNNTLGNGAYYHILWEQTGNNPNGGMANTMYGKKIAYYTINGRQLIVPDERENYYISGGRRVRL